MAIINPWIFYLIDVLSTLKQNSQFIAGVSILVFCGTGIVGAIAKSESRYDNLTKIEYYILKWAKENTEFKYLVRLKNGNLCAYSEKPFKDNQHRVWANKENVNSHLSMFNDLFEFINCEDSEPTSIEDVLKNCEVIKNESDK
jgi:hypothetical protein